MRSNLAMVPAVLLLALPAFTNAAADEGRIPIFQPTTIVASGHYILTRNIAVPGGGSGVVINASNVVLDLNGHTISATIGFGATENLVVISTGRFEVAVRNGHLTGGSHGVIATDGDRVRLEGLEIRDSADAGIRLGRMDYVEVLGCRVVNANSSSALGTDQGAIEVDGPSLNGRVSGNSVLNTFFDGIHLDGMRGGEVARNVVLATSTVCSSCGTGLEITGGGGNRVEDNVLRDGRGPGISIGSPGTLLFKNTVTGNAEGGISIGSDGNQVLENVVQANGDALDGPWGILVSGSDNRIKGNQVQGNLGHGVHVAGGSRNLVDDNVIEGQITLAWCGIQYDNALGHASRNNMLRGNPGGALCGSANTSTGNII